MNIAQKQANWFFDDLRADFYAGLNQWREISEDDFQYALGVLPPMAWKNGAFLIPEAYSGDVHSGFVEIGERYFAKYCNLRSFHSEADSLRATIAAAPVDNAQIIADFQREASGKLFI